MVFAPCCLCFLAMYSVLIVCFVFVSVADYVPDSLFINFVMISLNSRFLVSWSFECGREYFDVEIVFLVFPRS